jgi:hypothetical protein
MTEGLPELAAVQWRARASDRTLRRAGRLWTLTTAAHAIPLIAAAVVLAVLNPVTTPVGLVLLVHAWAIPELYANRGAKVIRPRPRAAGGAAERIAVGLLGDLLGHPARELHERTGLVLERARLGVWLIGESGALLVRPGGRRVHCFCVGVPDRELPAGDRKAHLLLALREDETGFATVANQAFAGAPWRVARRLPGKQREALRDAVGAAHPSPRPTSSPDLYTKGQCAIQDLSR